MPGTVARCSQTMLAELRDADQDGGGFGHREHRLHDSESATDALHTIDDAVRGTSETRMSPSLRQAVVYPIVTSLQNGDRFSTFASRSAHRTSGASIVLAPSEGEGALYAP
jgi:hypothetical protein